MRLEYEIKVVNAEELDALMRSRRPWLAPLCFVGGCLLSIALQLLLRFG